MNKKAFTLVEILFTLLIVGGILAMANQMILSYQQTTEIMTTDTDANWYLFASRLNNGLKDATYVSHDKNLLRYKDKEGYGTVRQYGNTILFKGGYIPYLYKVKTFEIDYVDPFLWIYIQMENGEKYVGAFYLESEK